MKKIVLITLLLTACNSAPPTQTIKPVFDIPILIGKNIDQVVKILGKPVEDDEPSKKQVKIGIIEWNKEFKKDGYEMLITYDSQTRIVKDFFVDASHHSCDSLVAIANLDENALNYTVTRQNELVGDNKCLGIKIVPK